MAGPSGSTTERRAPLVPAVLVAASLGTAWLLSLAAAGFGRDWNNGPNDLLFRLRHRLCGTGTVLPTIGYVDLSDSEVRALGMRGGDRKDFARLVKVLDAAGASSIVFDILFPERGQPDGDGSFARSVATARTVILPAILLTRDLDRLAGQPQAGGDPLALRIWRPKVVRAGSPPSANAATASFPELTEAAHGIAHINSEPDPDGIYRRMPLLIAYAGGFLPCLALRAAADALRVDPSAVEVSFGRSLLLPRAVMPDGSLRDIRIPIDNAGRMVLDFAGPWDAGFPHYSFSRLLEAERDRNVAEQAATELDGARLIVCDVTTSSNDFGPTPLDAVYPRSWLHGNILNSILLDRFLRAPRWWEVLPMNGAFAVMLWLLAWKARPLACSFGCLLSWAALAAGEFALFLGRGILPTLAAPTLGAVAVLVAANGYRFLLSEREKMAFRLRMERYFAPRLLSKILADRDRLASADRKAITVLFSDIAGFTSWSATTSPDAVHDTLNEYFEVMTEIVFRHEGTVDKFIGDGLMAFFGDPLPQPDHALRAVRSAVEMQQAVRRLRERWVAQGRMPLHIRIGVNTGDAVVGNMGSLRIMAYTAIGMNVNLGSRLEGKAPVDGVLVSASVHEAVRDKVDMRFAGRITAKGIAGDFDAWEVVIPPAL